MIRVAILGATGYTAAELINILLRHPEVEIRVLTTRREERPHVREIHPRFTDRLDLRLENLPAEEVAPQCDCVFSCLPHRASALVAADYLRAGKRVVDFSADYRLLDVATFEKWYAVEHPDPARVGHTPYGLPELFADEIRAAQLVANPGCFPTLAILSLAPLLQNGLIEANDIIIDAKTGVSGAGRTPKPPFHFPECNESTMAYGVGQHRHTPEIDQLLGKAGGQKVSVVFTPHLTPMTRGMLATIYVRPSGSTTAETAMQTLREFYADKPFVRIVDHLPSTRYVSHTNFCDITVRQSGNRLVLLACIDNLIKGASGAAVQNFNLMHGFEETLALL